VKLQHGRSVIDRSGFRVVLDRIERPDPGHHLHSIYRQLRLQRSVAAIEQIESLSNEWGSERMYRAYRAVLLAIEAGTDPGDLPEGAVAIIGDYWQKMEYLTRTGKVDARMLHDALSAQVQTSWARLRPTVLAWREQGTYRSDMYKEFESLAATMALMDAKRGLSHRTDDEYLAARMPGLIAQIRDGLQIEEALRAVPVQLASGPIPVTVVRETA